MQSQVFNEKSTENTLPEKPAACETTNIQKIYKVLQADTLDKNQAWKTLRLLTQFEARNS